MLHLNEIKYLLSWHLALDDTNVHSNKSLNNLARTSTATVTTGTLLDVWSFLSIYMHTDTCQLVNVNTICHSSSLKT